MHIRTLAWREWVWLVYALCACLYWYVDCTGTDLTLHDLRYTGLVRQTTEYSCGAAAIASLLDEYFGIDVTEAEVLEAVEAKVLARGEVPGVEAGLTAYDLLHASATFGLRLLGYQLDECQLEDYYARGGLPVISHVTKPRLHYVVIVGIAEANVLLCDPGCGRFVVPMSELGYAVGILYQFRCVEVLSRPLAVAGFPPG